jgi:hypothetical protein
VRIPILPFSEILLEKQDFNTKLSQKIKFLRLKIMCLWLSYKKKYGKKFFFGILKVTEEKSRIRNWPDPDPHQKVTNPQHWMI